LNDGKGAKLGVTLGDWMLVSEAARELGVGRHRVHQLIKSGVLRAQQLSPRLLMVERDSVAAYKKVQRPPGRPRRKSV
jgi:excisionase family DNA binding protein